MRDIIARHEAREDVAAVRVDGATIRTVVNVHNTQASAKVLSRRSEYNRAVETYAIE